MNSGLLGSLVAVDKRVVILCEGPSDEKILEVLFQNVKLSHIVPSFQPLDGATQFKEQKIRSRVCNSLKIPGTLAVFTLVDLKGFLVNYPKKVTSYTDRAKFVKEHLKNFLSGLSELDRFYPHIAVHDIEAWILADENAVANYFRRSTISYNANSPEAIDFDRPPSYILRDLFKGRNIEYRKTVHAPELFMEVNLDTVYNKCPHFRDFFDDLIKVTT